MYTLALCTVSLQNTCPRTPLSPEFQQSFVNIFRKPDSRVPCMNINENNNAPFYSSVLPIFTAALHRFIARLPGARRFVSFFLCFCVAPPRLGPRAYFRSSYSTNFWWPLVMMGSCARFIFMAPGYRIALGAGGFPSAPFHRFYFIVSVLYFAPSHTLASSAATPTIHLTFMFRLTLRRTLRCIKRR